MIKAFASLYRNTQGRSLRQVCHPPIPGKELQDSPTGRLTRNPNRSSKPTTTSPCSETTAPQTVKHSATFNSNNQSRKPSQARSQEDDDKILSEDLAAIQAHHQNRHNKTLKLAKRARQLEGKVRRLEKRSKTHDEVQTTAN